MGSCSPSRSAAPPALFELEQLSVVLDGQQIFHEAQGALAEIAGCTLRRAGEVLLQRGAHLGFQTSAGVTGYFLFNATNVSVDLNSQTAIAGSQPPQQDPISATSIHEQGRRSVLVGLRSTFLIGLSDLTFLDVAELRESATIQTQLSNDGDRLRIARRHRRRRRWMLQFAVVHGWVSTVLIGAGPRMEAYSDVQGY